MDERAGHGALLHRHLLPGHRRHAGRPLAGPGRAPARRGDRRAPLGRRKPARRPGNVAARGGLAVLHLRCHGRPRARARLRDAGGGGDQVVPGPARAGQCPCGYLVRLRSATTSPLPSPRRPREPLGHRRHRRHVAEPEPEAAHDTVGAIQPGRPTATFPGRRAGFPAPQRSAPVTATGRGPARSCQRAAQHGADAQEEDGDGERRRRLRAGPPERRLQGLCEDAPGVDRPQAGHQGDAARGDEPAVHGEGRLTGRALASGASSMRTPASWGRADGPWPRTQPRRGPQSRSGSRAGRCGSCQSRPG